MKKNSGNALFLILIAIFLLGAVTVFISRSSSTTEETGSGEQVSIQASEILKYSSGVAAAISRMMANGCSETEIRFYDPAFTYTNANARADKSCDVFDAAGGGMTYSLIAPKAAWKDSAYTLYWGPVNAQCVFGVGGGDTSTCTKKQLDMLFTLRGINLSLCNELNRRLGVASVSGAPPTDEIYVTYDPLFATFSGSLADLTIGDNAAAAVPLQNKKAGCLKDAGGGTAGQYFFYQVVMAR